ncbi:MAG: fused MFS/spermidine synthase, partial [Kiritimatiellia bacterium]
MFKTTTAPLRALRRNERWISAFFFCSGISALVYQVAWQRLLVLQSGVGIYSISVIVAAFLAGLGIGNITGGRWSLRLTPSGAMRAFSLVEISIGLFALISPLLYYQGFQHLPAVVYGNRLFTGIAHFSALLPPTLLMGMSFPLLVRAICREDWVSSTGIAGLYGLNTVGAALGAIITPWVLMRYWGIDGAIYIAAVINIVVGLASLYMRPFLAEGNPAELHATDDPNPPQLPWFWLLLYAASGCAGVGLEILWFRVLDTALKSTAFTFGTLLGWYLLCLGAGCVAGGAVARRSSKPLRTFLLCQTGAVAYALTAFLGFVWMPPSFPLYNDVYLYWQQMQSVTALEAGNVRIFLLLYVVMPLMFFGPVTFLQGLSFASLQRAVQNDPRHAGHRVGLLQAANIAGCVAGSLGVGLVGLQYAGTMGSLRLLAVFGFLFCLVGILRAGLRRSGLALLALLTFAVVFLPSNNSFWTRLHGQTIQDSIIGEDSTGLIALVPTHRGMGIRYKDVRIGGKFHSWLPYS